MWNKSVYDRLNEKHAFSKGCGGADRIEKQHLAGKLTARERLELLFDKDGGHGMVFRDKAGDLRFVMHAPNKPLLERPVLITVREENGTLVKV